MMKLRKIINQKVILCWTQRLNILVVKLYNVLKSIGIDAELDIKQPYSWLFSVYQSSILFDEHFDRLVNVIKRNNFRVSLTSNNLMKFPNENYDQSRK